ncbi:MAG: bifunctional riboflavin kinase/FAD synthetase [Prolixibacteraceae bacterium]|nr:bifunctional riboflavin kinase/FAD synthetase [Prolixibacteraceae bacterium]
MHEQSIQTFSLLLLRLIKSQVLIIHHNIRHFKALNPVVTIGTFDGVHLGHRKVIDQLKTIASEVGGESVIFTFYPHPRLVVSGNENNLRLLTTLEEKTEQLRLAGIDHLVVYPFSPEFAKLTYREFIEEVLVGQMQLHTLVMGHDHRLGRNREGSYENILALSETLGFSVQKIDALVMDHVDISSSKIRQALQEGNIEKVNNYLGYRFTIHGTVAVGNQIGRSIGFPTANIEASDPWKIIPAEGVYAVLATVGGQTYQAMLNIGFRPTINANADRRTIEAHLFNFHGDIYQQEVTLEFHHRVREEQKFDSLELLRTQLERDKALVLKLLS